MLQNATKHDSQKMKESNRLTNFNKVNSIIIVFVVFDKWVQFSFEYLSPIQKRMLKYRDAVRLIKRQFPTAYSFINMHGKPELELYCAKFIAERAVKNLLITKIK